MKAEEALKTAETENAIVAVLSKCVKVSDMVKALLAKGAGMIEIYSVLLEMSREALTEVALSAGIASGSKVVDDLMVVCQVNCV